jgi:hypothetical protein
MGADAGWRASMMRLGKKLAVAAVGCLLSVAPAVPAVAASHQPKGEYAPFAECPLSIKTVTDCVYSPSDGGAFSVGGKEVPLFKSLILQGGFEGGGDEITFHGAENGATVSSSPQPLAGLLEVTPPASWPKFLQDWFNEGVKEGADVIATIELALPASEIILDTEALVLEERTALGLPLKVKLENQILGSHCYVGSAAEPLELKYTTGRNGSLKGSAGTLSFNRTMRMSTIVGGKLVDGTFAAPGASGCGGLLSYYLDPLVDSIFDLPSSGGKNTAVLEGKLQDAQAEAVKASE